MTLLRDILQSLFRLPLWVQVWMLAILMPVNMLTLALWGQPGAGVITGLAWLGLAVNLPIVLSLRGFGRLLAVPHVLFWTPAVAYALWLLASGSVSLTSGYGAFLALFIIVDTISLVFDVNDTRAWLRGDRGAA